MATDKNNNILDIPELSHSHHYETTGSIKYEDDINSEVEIPQEETSLEDKHVLLPVLDELMKIQDTIEILPEPERNIIDKINRVLIDFTKGNILDDINNYDDNDVVVPSGESNISNDKFNEKRPDVDSDTYDDLFPDDININFVPGEQYSMKSLSHNAYMRDYNDVLREYTSATGENITKFLQVMLTIANEAKIPDYNYLMLDFDLAAVDLNGDDNLQHLKDSIGKSQAYREQLSLQMEKLYNTENTLIRSRSWFLSEKQRERYISENYKANDSTVCTTFGNDQLRRQRDLACKNYDKNMYGLYKYLKSSTDATKQSLDMRMNEAFSKGQLAENGVDIFAVTPEPKPTVTNLDNNSKATKNAQSNINKYVDTSSKESVLGSQSDSIAIGSTAALGIGGKSGGIGIQNINGNVTEASDQEIAKSKEIAEKVSKLSGVPVDWVWAQMAHETGGFTSDLAKEGNYAGIKYGGETDSEGHSYYTTPEAQEEFIRVYANTLKNEPDIENAKTIEDFASCLKKGGYYADTQDNYVNGLKSWLPNGSTIVK